MRGNELLSKITDIDDKLIETAYSGEKAQKSFFNRKLYVAVAACMALIIFIPILSNMIVNQKDAVRPLQIVEFLNAYYELAYMDKIEVLKNYNIPNKITEDMIGDYAGVAVQHGDKQEVALFELVLGDAKIHARAVMVAKINFEDYTYAIFSGFIEDENNTVAEITSLLSVYGIDSAEDIQNIQAVYRDNKKTKGSLISDKETISQFYNIMMEAIPRNNEQFQLDVFGLKSEKEQQELCTKIADNSTTIKVVTTDNVVCYIHYNSFTKYIYWFLGYYKLYDDNCIFINKNLFK